MLAGYGNLATLRYLYERAEPGICTVREGDRSMVSTGDESLSRLIAQCIDGQCYIPTIRSIEKDVNAPCFRQDAVVGCLH